MNKQSLLNAVVEILEKDLQAIVDASSVARKAATEGEAKAEHKYDTRGIEQSYLADGQARRGAELMESIAHLKALPLLNFQKSSPVQISAIVEVESEREDFQLFFILPSRGGIKVDFEGQEILTLSPDSPMGENILGKFTGDEFEVKLKNKIHSYSIRSIR